MDTSWIEMKDFPQLKSNTPEMRRIPGLIKKLRKEYPTGEEWLNTPIEKKKTIKCGNTKEEAYIMAWTLERGLMKDPFYRKKIIEYYSNQPYKMGVLCLNYSLYYNFITPEEIEKIKEIRPINTKQVINSLCRICISYGKPFKDITDEELQDEIIDWALIRGLVSRNSVQKIRFTLDYSTKPKIMFYNRQSNTLVAKFPNLTREIQDYQIYFKNAGYSYNTIKGKNSSLSTFLTFIEEQNVDLSQIDRINFFKYSDWLRTIYDKPTVIYTKFSECKLFIEWGLNEYPSFPKVLDFPNELLSSLSKASIEYLDNIDGLAFPIENLATKIILECYDYSPKTEIEAVCRDFWLIVGTCPVRFDFVLSLSQDCLQPMLNDDRLLGLTSEYRDKGGNIHGHFPFFDHIGIQAVRRLQKRCLDQGFKSIFNRKNKLTYIHLFQIEYGVLGDHTVRNFLHEKILPDIQEIEDYKAKNDGELFKIGAHGFRHYIATIVQARTRNTRATQFILGHHDIKMTYQYLRSKVSRNTLLYSLIDGYEKKTLSGKFYLKVIELWADSTIEDSKLFDVLTSEMELSEFLKQYGRKRDMGWCMTEDSCENFFRCWGCHHFILRKEEIEEAISKLAKYFVHHKNLIKFSKNYTNENPIAADSIKTIALIQKRLTDLGVKPEVIWEMVNLKLRGRDIKEALQNDELKPSTFI